VTLIDAHVHIHDCFDPPQFEATFACDYTWHAPVTGDIPGRWSFRWQHELSGSLSQSEWHNIDVVVWEIGQVYESLIRLQEYIDASGVAPRSHAMLPFEFTFMRLERALATELAATEVGDAEKVEIKNIINRLRESLSGQKVPDEFVPEPIKSR